jgi:2-keto-4-pentenoate hydratase/2-oxohepta-3-ene-1,7-dioic acid hydratase in catechol pathway
VRLYSFARDEGIECGRIEGDVVVIDAEWRDNISDAADDSLEAYLDAQRRAAGSERLPVGSVAPAAAVHRPRKVICVGLNYRDHVAEGGRPPPDRPLLFSKFANAVIADGEPIIRPEGTHALDLEVELGVVIGRTARRVARAEAMDYVAGYVVFNDVSARDWQGVPAALREGEKGDGQWLRAKGSDTFLPMGPVFVTKDELDPATGLRLRSWRITADGEEHLMQDGTTADMIWDVPALIEFISASITLEAGDVIATGTPSGVGVFRDPPVFLQPGDRVRCEIEGIGSVENPIIDWSEAPV